jgi:hypothetical protein
VICPWTLRSRWCDVGQLYRKKPVPLRDGRNGTIPHRLDRSNLRILTLRIARGMAFRCLRPTFLTQSIRETLRLVASFPSSGHAAMASMERPRFDRILVATMGPRFTHGHAPIPNKNSRMSGVIPPEPVCAHVGPSRSHGLRSEADVERFYPWDVIRKADLGRTQWRHEGDPGPPPAQEDHTTGPPGFSVQ